MLDELFVEVDIFLNRYFLKFHLIYVGQSFLEIDVS